MTTPVGCRKYVKLTPVELIPAMVDTRAIAIPAISPRSKRVERLGADCVRGRSAKAVCVVANADPSREVSGTCKANKKEGGKALDLIGLKATQTRMPVLREVTACLRLIHL